MSESVSVANTVQVASAAPDYYVVPPPISTVGVFFSDGFWLNSQGATDQPSKGVNVARFMGHANAGYDVETIFRFDNVVFSTESLL